jgi:hypothetical protein
MVKADLLSALDLNHPGILNHDLDQAKPQRLYLGPHGLQPAFGRRLFLVTVIERLGHNNLSVLNGVDLNKSPINQYVLASLAQW